MDLSSKIEKKDEAIGDGVAEEELGIKIIRAAMDGNVKIFTESNLSKEHFFRKRGGKNNILHIAVCYEQDKFVKAFLEKYLPTNKKIITEIITERNSQGNTPLHVAAEVQNKDIVEMLFNYLKESVEGQEGDEKKHWRPWRAQNSEGNTALHVALLYHNIGVAQFLLDKDPGLAGIVNNSKEAPLHLAITLTGSELAYQGQVMTRVLLEKASSKAAEPDAKGLTPLHRAASLNPPLNLKVTKMIIEHCPESTLVCDACGKSILHLLIDKVFDREDVEGLIRLKEIRILKNRQDKAGNTPSHVAAYCKNIHMARSLRLNCSADLFIKNKDGISAWSMLEKQDLLRQLIMRTDESSYVKKGDINYVITKQGITGVEFYGSQDSEGNNILHLLLNKTAEHHYLSSSDNCRSSSNFIEKTLDSFPELVSQTDGTGNTPVHILAQNKYFCETFEESRLLRELLSNCAKAITKNKDKGINEADNQGQLWVKQNADGNTPLHEAIIANNEVLVDLLLRYSEESTHVVNKRNETPLHLLAGTDSGMEEKIMKMVVNANIEALELPDKDGLTPIMRALKAENREVVGILLDTVKFGGINGQTFWHLILYRQSEILVNGLLQTKTFRNMLKQKDNDGNTPLHLAMKEKRFKFVEYVLESWGRAGEFPESEQGFVENVPESWGSESESPEREQLNSKRWLMDLLKIVDSDGLTPIIRALKADNPNLATRLCLVNPEAAKMGDINGKTIWHLLAKCPSYKSENVKKLLKTEALRKVLEQTDKDGNTSLHLAIKEKCFYFVHDLLETSRSESESREREQLNSKRWLMDLLKIMDNDGLTPIISALKADNPDLATTLCLVNPEAATMGDINGKTIWHLLVKYPSYKSENVKKLLKTEALRKVLEQTDKDGNTSLHLAIKEKCFDFVHDLLETSGSESESLEGNQWLMNLLRMPNNVGETPGDLLADLSTISHKLEKRLLTDRRTKGIRSSWRIPRTQLQNYMNSMNVIAALQTTITFTAAFTVPGGLIQDIGTPILIQSIPFQIFMISDVIAMCLSMMVLICLLWMVATDKRESVMIQDFAVTLLLASFVATLMTFMAGVYATIFPVKPWIAIATLVLCSFLMLLVHRFMVTKLLLPFKNAASNFVQMFVGPAARFCTKTIENLRSGGSEHMHFDYCDTSPYERDNIGDTDAVGNSSSYCASSSQIAKEVEQEAAGDGSDQESSSDDTGSVQEESDHVDKDDEEADNLEGGASDNDDDASKDYEDAPNVEDDDDDDD